jgi:hypothetical protein
MIVVIINEYHSYHSLELHMQPMVDSDRLKNQAKVQCNSVIRDDNGVGEYQSIMTYLWMV